MTALGHDPYETGVLMQEVHERLVADIEHIADAAAIQKRWIWTPLAGVVGEPVVQWVRTFRKHSQMNLSGLCLIGPKPQDAAMQVSAVTGALIRNFIDARVMTCAQIYERAKSGEVPNPTCLLISNFFLGESHGIKLASWEIAALQDLLFDRHMRGQSTVIYATNLDAMASEYGSAITQLVQANYTRAKLVGGNQE